MNRTSLPTLLGAVLLVTSTSLSCSSDDDKFSDADAQALCRQVVDTLCEKLFECLSDVELAGLGYTSTVAACKTQLRDEEGCDAFTATKGNCKGSEVFKKNKADDCVRQLGQASCNQVESSDDYAPACEETCKVE
jgi:hypothetical protein